MSIHSPLQKVWIFPILLSFSLFLGYSLGAFFAPEKIIVREGTAENQAAESSVNLMLDYGNGIIRTWNTVSWEESMSVLDLIEKVASTGVISTERESVDGKDRLKSVDGITNDLREERRWQFWVNNVYEPRIMSRYFLKPGDTVVISYAKE